MYKMLAEGRRHNKNTTDLKYRKEFVRKRIVEGAIDKITYDRA